MSDLLWSDPQPFPGVGISKRGVGVAFGPDITKGFCETNGLGAFPRARTHVCNVRWADTRVRPARCWLQTWSSGRTR